MRTSRRGIISFLLFFIVFFGCRHKKHTNNKSERESLKNMFDEGLQIKGDAINVLYKLPDTLTIKDTLKGYIVYKSVYDTLRVPNKEHFVDFYLAKTNFLSKDYMEFRTKKSDTFARIRDSIIPIYDITFKKRGAHMLEGYIVDHLYYDVGNDSVHYKSLKNQVMYSVYVK